MMSNTVDPSRLRPCEALIYQRLEYEGALTFSEIVTQTGRGSSTVERALNQLESDGLIECYRTNDLRERKYEIQNNE